MQLKGKVNAPGLELEGVDNVEKQVVAGTNYRMKIRVKNGASGSEAYSVVVYGTTAVVERSAFLAQAPPPPQSRREAASVWRRNGAHELRKSRGTLRLCGRGGWLSAYRAPQHPSPPITQQANNDAAAQFAAKHVSSMSNSLIPLELQEVVSSSVQGNVHTLTIKVGREGLTPTTWNVVVEEDGNGFVVKNAVPAA